MWCRRIKWTASEPLEGGLWRHGILKCILPLMSNAKLLSSPDSSSCWSHWQLCVSDTARSAGVPEKTLKMLLLLWSRQALS